MWLIIKELHGVREVSHPQFSEVSHPNSHFAALATVSNGCFAHTFSYECDFVHSVLYEAGRRLHQQNEVTHANPHPTIHKT